MQNAASKKSSVRHSPSTSQIDIAPWVAFVAAAISFALTAPHSVTFEDSGLFILSAQHWGLPHPPGYPLYTGLAHLFTYLPFGTVAFRVSLFSVGCGAVAAILLYRLFLHFSDGKISALLTAGVVVFSATIWSQAIVAEVYALHLVLALAFLLQLVRLRKNLSSKGFLLLGLTAAMALCNHWPLFVFCGPGFLLMTSKEWWTKKNIGYFVLGLSAAIWPYLLMWWRSNQNPEISFLGEISSFSELWAYIRRKYYSASDVSALHTWRDVALFYGEFFRRLAVSEYALPAVGLGAIGLWRWVARGERRILIAYLYLMLAPVVFLPLLVRLEFNQLNENIFRVFWLVPFALWGVFIAKGAAWVNERKRSWGAIALAIILVITFAFNLKSNNLRSDHFAESYARVVLESVPPSSPLVASTDGDVGPIAYTQMIVGVNPTIELYTGTGVFFRRRIFDPFLRGVEKKFQRTLAFLQEKSPVYSVKNLVLLEGRKNLPVVTYFDGLTYRYSNYEQPHEPVRPEIVTMAEQALTHYLDHKQVNNWPYHRGTLAARLCNILVLRGNENHPAFEHALECKQVLARHLAATQRREGADALFLQWINEARRPIVREKQQFIYHFFVNRLELVNSLRGNADRQRELLREALPIAETTLFEYPLCDNMVYPVLNSIRSQVELSPETLRQLTVFANCK